MSTDDRWFSGADVQQRWKSGFLPLLFLVSPFPIPGDLPDSGIEPTSLTSPALAGGFFTTSTTCVRVYVRTTYINYILNADYPILESTFVMTTVCPWKVM